MRKHIYTAPEARTIELFAETALLTGSPHVEIKDEEAAGSDARTNRQHGWSSELWDNSEY